MVVIPTAPATFFMVTASRPWPSAIATGAAPTLGLALPEQLEVARQIRHDLILANCLRHTQMKRTFRMLCTHYAAYADNVGGHRVPARPAHSQSSERRPAGVDRARRSL